MTPYQLKRRAISAFANYDVPKHVRRRYQRDWLKIVQTLGDKWLYARYIDRLDPGGVGATVGADGVASGSTHDSPWSKSL